MGQTLSEPITTKETTSLRNSSVTVASSCMQGWRVSMEDAHQHILQLSPEDPDAAFFAVFDGHGGSRVAQYSSINLHKLLVKRPEYVQQNYALALQQSFLECDRAMKVDSDLKDEMAGCTAVTVLLKGDRLWCANAGDSRCIAGVGGKAVALSNDHKPNDKLELERITKAGGYVDSNRVNGNLALSRALGDFIFKMNDQLPQNEQIVSAEPDVEEATITSDWDFILIACDGIWDVLSNQEVCEFVTSRIGRGVDPSQICEELMDRCLAPDCMMGGLGCDNMTVVLICLLQGKPWANLVARCAQNTPKHNSAETIDSEELSEGEKETGQTEREAGEDSESETEKSEEDESNSRATKSEQL